MAAKKKRSKKKTGATRNVEQSSSNWSWIVMGLLVGLFVAFLVYLDKIPTNGGLQNSTSGQGKSKSSTQKDSRTSKEKKAKPPEHQFDFYTVLPDREVEIIELDDEPETKIIAPIKDSTTTQKASSEQSTALYQLQVGAFKELSKADAMKARLAFLGVESNIQVIRANDQKMYRVRVGPSTDSQKINQIRKQLKAKNINTFMQKLKG